MSEPIDLRTAPLEDLRGRDLTPGMVARAKQPKPTWFVKRLGNPRAGEVLAVEEKEAWDILYNRSAWKRRDFEFIGYSDGTTYAKYAAEAMKSAGQLEPEIAALKIEIEKYRRAEEKLVIDEAVDMDGEPEDTANEANKQKVLRLRKILEKHEVKLEEKEKAHRNFSADVVKKATEAELKVAMKNWKKGAVWPEQANISTPGVSGRERTRILGMMERGGMG